MRLSYYKYSVSTGIKQFKTNTAFVISGITVSLAGLVLAVAMPLGVKAAVGGPTCSVPTDYATILLAVNAPGCSTINVAAGTYNENVTINRTLTLNGAQAMIDARTRSGAESVINGSTGANLTITANNVTVDGFTLNGPVSQGSAAVVMNGGNSGETIQNNIFNNPGRAVSFNTSNTLLTKNRVNNIFATAGDGFQANSSPVNHVTVSDNNFSGANGSIYNADITIIEGNANIVVKGNKATKDGTLVALFKTNGAQISGNTVISDGASSAIYIGGGDSNVTVSKNTVSSAGSAVNIANGFGIGANASITIQRNNLHNNLRGIKVGATAVTSANTVVAHRNKLTDNSEFGFNNLSTFSANATCNWWGAANGPGPIGPGSGDKVSTNVTFSPWLKSSNLNGKCGVKGDKSDEKDVEDQSNQAINQDITDSNN